MKDILLMWLLLVLIIMSGAGLTASYLNKQIKKETEIILRRLEQYERMSSQDIDLLLNENREN